jgi:hypothetical protein
MKKSIRKILSLILVLTLTAAAILSLNSCGKKKIEQDDGVVKTITVTVIDDKGESSVFTITTTKATLRGALEQENMIEGDEDQYGLYVKYVNGIRADYDKDKAYWAFSKDGVDLMTGVDSTEISDGDKYEITYTKG